MIAILHDSPAHLIRSKQCGDWRYTSTSYFASVVNEYSEDSKLAVLIHELIECYLCKKAGIKDEDVVAFDDKFEAERDNGMHGMNEPGDDPASPYRQQHMMATHVEKAVCVALNITWEQHEKDILET